LVRVTLRTRSPLGTRVSNTTYGSVWMIKVQPTKDGHDHESNTTHGSVWMIKVQPTTGGFPCIEYYAPVALALPNRKTPMDVASQIRVPVQGHYGTRDSGVRLADVRRFEETLRAQGTWIEIFTYDAGHGFFASDREDAYQPEAARVAWSRTLSFLKLRGR
jgi:hypothetical protein